MANAALICVCVPANVNVEVAFTPAETVAPPARLTSNVPLVTDS